MPKEKLKGIGGWLILPIIGLFLSIFFILYDLLSTNSQYQFNAYIGILSSIDVGLLIFTVTCLILIFNKKKSAPKFVIAFYITNIILQGTVAFLINDYSGVTRTVIAGAIWIPYFIKSERVKNTFVK